MRRDFLIWMGVALIAALACGLYLPFLNNQRVFDDWVFFSGEQFAYFATHPFGLGMRLPPYFSLAITEIELGSMQAHRIVSLLFHIACALALYRLIFGSLRAVSPESGLPKETGRTAALWACIGAGLFAIHPVAVYGAGYLVQRTIVLATLFSLLSLILFVRGLERRRQADAISAALMFSIAVLCKEHSVLLPAVAVLAVPLLSSDRRFGIRYAVLYLSACAPAAIFVALLAKGVIGKVYEPEFGSIAAQIGGAFGDQIVNFPWSMSAVTQAGL